MQDELRERIEEHAQDVREAGPGETRDYLIKSMSFEKKMKNYKLKLTR